MQAILIGCLFFFFFFFFNRIEELIKQKDIM